MVKLDGIWRLMDSCAWTAEGEALAPPYGAHPMGMILFSQGRMLATLCNGDQALPAEQRREFSSYGGRYSLDGDTLTVEVDIASDPSRVGGRQLRTVVLLSERQILLRPPQRQYVGGGAQRRELCWERVSGSVVQALSGSL